MADLVMDLAADSNLEAEIKLVGAMSHNLDFNEAMMKHPRVLPCTSDGGAPASSGAADSTAPT